MKVLCERDALRTALGHVASRARSKSPIPILHHVMIEATADNRVALTATDLDTCCVATCPGEVTRPATTTVSADRLARLVDGMPAGAQVLFDLRGTDLHVESGRSRYKLPTLPASDFPETASITDGIDITLVPAEAKRLFGEPTPAVSTEATRFYLCGVHLAQRKGQIMATATNGICLVRLTVKNGAKFDKGYIIPKVAMVEIVKLAGNGNVSLRIDDNRIEARAGNVVFTSKLIDATYPDADRVIPAPQAEYLEVERPEFTSAFKRLAGLAEDGSTIDIRWKSGEQSIEMSLSGSGSGTESVGCDCAMPAGEISFQPHILGEMLDVFGGEVIQLHAVPNSPMLIVDPADTALTVVAMPCRSKG